MIKNFRERVLEESFQDKYDSFLNKGKNFVKNNPYLTTGAGGLAAGALLNYMGDGADDLKASREDDIKEWFGKGAREDLAGANTMDKDTYTDIRDAAYRSSIPGNQLSAYVQGNTEDYSLFGNKETDQNNIINLAKANEQYNIVTGSTPGGVSVGGHNMNLTTTSDKDYDNYTSGIKAKYNQMTNGEIEHHVGQNKELNNDLRDMRSDVDHATRDSYLKKTLGGAALGAGGVFAKRKLDERR